MLETRSDTRQPGSAGSCARPWYAVRTRSNHEKIVAGALAARGIEQYLPFLRTSKGSMGRDLESKMPLFPGYVFCKFEAEYRTQVLSAPGIASIVAFGGQPAPIATTEIESIQIALDSGRLAEPCPYIQEGQRIRLESGPLKGLEGVLLKKRNWRIVVSVELLRRSVALEIDPESIVAV